MKRTDYIHVIVYSTSHALQIESLLNERGIPNKLIPVPRRISSDCGVCIRVPAESEAELTRIISESGLEIQGVVP